VRRIIVVAFVTLLSVLPSVDVLYCPDGCSDMARTESAWQHCVPHVGDECGLCLNGVAVHRDMAIIEPIQPFVDVTPRVSATLIPIPPRSLGRPPRVDQIQFPRL